MRGEVKEAVARATAEKEFVIRREALLRLVVEEFLRAWDVPYPENLADLPKVLPLPPARGVDRGTMTLGRPGKMEAAVSPARPVVSIASVQTDAVRGGKRGEDGGSLLQRMEEVLEARLATFWERVSQCLPGGSREPGDASGKRGDTVLLRSSPERSGDFSRSLPDG